MDVGVYKWRRSQGTGTGGGGGLRESWTGRGLEGQRTREEGEVSVFFGQFDGFRVSIIKGAWQKHSRLSWQCRWRRGCGC